MTDNSVEIVVTAKDDTKRAFDSAEKGVKGVGDAADKAGTKVKGFGADADTAGYQVKGLGDIADRSGDQVRGLSDRIGSGGADLRRYGQDLDGVGDGFNDVEDRAMGAGNIINGVNDIMSGGDPATYAMGLSDLAAGIRYTVVPSLQDGARGLKSLTTSLGGVKGLLVGGGIAAGAIGLGVALKQMGDAENAKAIDNVYRALRRGHDVTVQEVDALLAFHQGADGVSGVLRNIAEQSGPAAAARFVEVAKGANLSDQELAALDEELAAVTRELEGSAAAAEGLSNAIRGVADAQRANSDPMFAYLDATTDLADAIREEEEATTALQEAQESGDPVAIAEAQRRLEEAHRGVMGSAYDARDATQELSTMLSTGQITVDGMRAELRRLEEAGYGSGAAAQWLRDRINEIQSKHVTLSADAGQAIEQARTLYETLSLLPESKMISLGFSSYDVAELNRFTAGRKKASGGVIGGLSMAASGGIRGLGTLVGERGPELVDLPVGSTVTPAATTAAMLGDAGGGQSRLAGEVAMLRRQIDWIRTQPARVEVVLSLDPGRGGHTLGTAFMEALRYQIRRETGGNVQAALGWSNLG